MSDCSFCLTRVDCSYVLVCMSVTACFLSLLNILELHAIHQYGSACLEVDQLVAAWLAV